MIAVVCLIVAAFCICSNQIVFRSVYKHNTSAASRAIVRQEVSPTIVSPTKDAIKFGEQQMLQMLNDRPAMQGYIRPNDPIWIWCVHQFAGEGTGEQIEWNPDPPEETNASDCKPSSGAKKAFICVRKDYPTGSMQGQDRTGEELWANTIYELNNLQNGKEFKELYFAAREGKLTKENWTRRNLQLEYGTLQRTRTIYKTLWAPLMRSRGILSEPYLDGWGVYTPDTFDEFLKSLADGPDSTVNYYYKMYDIYISSHNGSSDRTQSK